MPRFSIKQMLVATAVIKVGFYEDLRKATRPSDAPTVLIGELKDIRVDGDSAIGYVTAPLFRSNQSSRSKTLPWQVKYVNRKYRFRQIQNGWLIETTGGHK
jgi:hypothetical protein